MPFVGLLLEKYKGVRDLFSEEFFHFDVEN
jgi:hypothetical protein